MFGFFKKKSIPKEPMTLEEYIKFRRDKGDSKEKIRKDLVEDLKKGGPIFKDLREAIKATSPGSVKRFADEQGIPGKYIWSVCKGKRDPVCSDCLERDGQIKTWEEWEKLGLPRAGKTQCKNGCKCVLLPAMAENKKS